METSAVQPVVSRPWHQIWWEVLSKPGAETFLKLIEEPNADAKRGYIWMLVTGLISGLFAAAIALVAPQASASQSSIAMAVAASVFCTPFVAFIGLVLSAGLIHWISKLFGGQGDWGKLVFCLAAVQAPILLIRTVFSLAGLLGSGSEILTGCVTLGLSLYILALCVFAVSVAENISTGNALVVLILPGATVLVIALIVMLVSLSR